MTEPPRHPRGWVSLSRAQLNDQLQLRGVRTFSNKKKQEMVEMLERVIKDPSLLQRDSTRGASTRVENGGAGVLDPLPEGARDGEGINLQLKGAGASPSPPAEPSLRDKQEKTVGGKRRRRSKSGSSRISGLESDVMEAISAFFLERKLATEMANERAKERVKQDEERARQAEIDAIIISVCEIEKALASAKSSTTRTMLRGRLSQKSARLVELDPDYGLGDETSTRATE